MSLTILWQDPLTSPRAEELGTCAEAIERTRDEWRHVSVLTATGNAYALSGARGTIQCGINGGPHGCTSGSEGGALMFY